MVMFVLIIGHWLGGGLRTLTAGRNTKAVLRGSFRAESSHTLSGPLSKDATFGNISSCLPISCSPGLPLPQKQLTMLRRKIVKQKRIIIRGEAVDQIWMSGRPVTLGNTTLELGVHGNVLISNLWPKSPNTARLRLEKSLIRTSAKRSHHQCKVWRADDSKTIRAKHKTANFLSLGSTVLKACVSNISHVC